MVRILPTPTEFMPVVTKRLVITVGTLSKSCEVDADSKLLLAYLKYSEKLALGGVRPGVAPT